MSSIEPSKGVGFAAILGGIGLLIGVLANVAYFQEGGRVSIVSIGLYPALGFGLGSWIDSKRDKS